MCQIPDFNGGNVVPSPLHVLSVELGFHHGSRQSWEVDIQADCDHIFLSSKSVLVHLLGLGVISLAVLADQINAEKILVAVDDDVETGRVT